MFKLVKFLYPFKWVILCILVLLFVQAMADLALPEYLARIVNIGIQQHGIQTAVSGSAENGGGLSVQTRFILGAGGKMLLIALLGTVCSVTVGFLSARVASGFSRDTRKRLFRKVETFSNVEFDRFTTASLITRTTNDIEQIQMLMVMMLRMVFYAPLMGIGGIIKVFGEDVSMIWIIAVAVVLMMMLISVEFFVAVPRFKIVQNLVDRLNLVTREILTGLMVIRAFNTQGYQEKKFDGVNAHLSSTNLFINCIMSIIMPGMMLVMNCAMLGILWFGSHRVDLGAMQVGTVMAFMQYAMQIIFSFVMVSVTFMMMPRAGVSAQRISEVLDTEPLVRDPETPERFEESIRGRIEFKRVWFKYPGADDYALRDISFSAEPGQTTAVIGGTGSGKSTLINLIPRFYDVSEGSILLDGRDIRTVTQHDLRETIGFVPQKAVLFSGTVGSNVLYGNESATDEQLMRAIDISQSRDFVSGEEAGTDADITRGGLNLSGGQRQRLAIARALARNSQIFIFDDSFSAIDFKTDAALRRALRTEMKIATVLIVAQRISTIMTADKIVVLNNGRVEGIGSHRHLMDTCGVYRELALSQLSRKELDA